MKKLITLLSLMVSLSTFATASFECSTSNGDTTIIGHIGAGNTILDDLIVFDKHIHGHKYLAATMKWLNYETNELKVISYDVDNDIELLRLDTEGGFGKLSLKVVGHDGKILHEVNNANVMCDF